MSKTYLAKHHRELTRFSKEWLHRFTSAFRKQKMQDDEKAVYTHLVHEIDPDSHSPGDSTDTLLPSPPQHAPRSPTKRFSSIILKASLLLLAFWGLTSLGHLSISRLHPPTDPQSLSCSCGGTTVADALARGCIFTPLAIAWLPPHCIDQALSDEFDVSGPGPGGSWDYFADPQGTATLNRTEVGLLADRHDGVFYASQNWHITHCTFTWRKHYRSKTTGVTIERRSNGLDHIGHCEKIFRIRGGLEDVMTMAGIALDADDPGETSL